VATSRNRRAPGPGLVLAARGVWQRLRALVDETVTRVGDDITEVPWVMGAATLAALVAVLLLHALEALTLGRPLLLQIGGLLPAFAISAGLVALLLWAYWRVRLAKWDARSNAILALSVVTVAVTIEAFAGLIAVLGQRGVVRTGDGGTPSLLSSEVEFLWQFAHAVPILAIPDTLHWQEPLAFNDQIAGGVTLLFKIALIIPLARLVIAAYQFIRSDIEAAQRKRWERDERAQIQTPSLRRRLLWPHRQGTRTVEAWSAAFYWMVLAGGAVFVTQLIFDPTRLGRRWFIQHAPSEIAVGDRHIPLGWVPATAGVLAAGILLVVLGQLIMVMYEDSFFTEPRTAGELLGALAAYIALLIALFCVCTVVLLVLLDVSLADTRPALPSRSFPGAATWLGWKSSDAIPVLSVPATLNWPLVTVFTDSWSAVLLLLFEVAVLSLLLVVLPGLVLSYSRRIHRPGSVLGMLAFCCRFRDDLRIGHSILDEVEEAVLAKLIPGALPEGSQSGPADLRRPATGSLVDLHQMVSRAQQDFDYVSRVFGPGEVSETGRTALALLEQRAELVVLSDSGIGSIYPGSVAARNIVGRHQELRR
jgi:hypothetical protein